MGYNLKVNMVYTDWNYNKINKGPTGALSQPGEGNDY